VIKLNPKTMSEAKVNRTMRELVEARLELARTSRSILGMFVLGEGESYDSVNAQITGFAELIKTLQDDLVLKWGMPRALVFGEAPGGLTASSAPFMDAWRLRVDEYRESVTPLVEYVARCLLSTIGSPGSNFRVEWAALTPANALQDAQADTARAQTAGTLIQSGVLGPDAAADWLRSQGLELPEAKIGEDPGAGAAIAAAIGEAEPAVAEGAEPAAIDPAAQVSTQGVAPVTEKPKEPFPVGFVSAATELAKAVNSGEVAGAQARGILKSMMGVDPAGAEEIAPDRPGVTPDPAAQSNSATDAAPADSLWIGAVPAAVWEERLAPIRDGVAAILADFAPDPEPHLTVLYLGSVAGDVADLAVEEAQRAVKRLTADGSDLPAFCGSRIALMSPDDDGRRAVALGGEAWGLYQIRDDLQAALGDLIAPDVRGVPWRPHVTLGYATAEITPAQRERLAVLVEAPVMLPIAQIAVRADRETPLAVLKTFDAATYHPPQGAQGNARKVLRWREEHGDDVKGMTSAGWIRAAQLARGEPISAEIVVKIASFVRFREDYEAAAARIRAGESEPWQEAAYVAWLGWGGETGIEWAEKIQEARRAPRE
jgi:2'-5' RNA ligase